MNLHNLQPLGNDAFQGIAGEIVLKVLPHSEADTAGLLAHVLVAAGNIIGRNHWFTVGGIHHHANLFAVLTGRTGSGRKGQAKADAFHAFRGIDDGWMNDRRLPGMSSGEGLIWAVRDPIYGLERDRNTKETAEVLVDPGVSDKRLFVVETEFASVLRRMTRETNTLSMVIRQAWDGEAKLNTMTKGSQATATDAHISIIGHITSDELRKEMSQTEAFNGFVNRFLWFQVSRSKLLPDGGNLEDEDFQSIRQELAAVLSHSKAGMVGAMERDSQARELWHEVYGNLNAEEPGILGHVIARAAPQVMRLAMIYAILDQSALIKLIHLKAGLEVWRYCKDSAACLFGGKPSDPKRDKHISHIRKQKDGTITIRDFHNRFCRELPTADEARAVLRKYAEMGLGKIIPLPLGRTGGAPSYAFKLSAADTVDSGQYPDSASSSAVLSTPSDNNDRGQERDGIHGDKSDGS